MEDKRKQLLEKQKEILEGLKRIEAELKELKGLQAQNEDQEYHETVSVSSKCDNTYYDA